MASQLLELTGPQMQEATEPTETRRRKKEERVVIRVRAGDRCGKEKGSGTPADSWSWRKYGQKPIKGSPYPRSYYRCSASKGCPAKKQVERCSTDASIIVVTYALDHNHPGPRLLHLSSICKAQELDAIDEDQGDRETPRPQSPLVMLHSNCRNHQDTQEGKNCSEQQSSDVSIKREGDAIASEAARMRREEDRFFDELGELPLSLLCSSVLSSNFFDERKLLLPF